MNRTQIIREPGLIQFNSAYFYAPLITVTQVDDTFDISTGQFGKIEDRVKDRKFEIKFTPVGEWEHLGVLFPYFSTLIGADIYGSTDVPLTIWTASGNKYVFVNAAITAVPQIKPKIGGTLLGDVTFTALLAKDAAPGDTSAYYTLTTGETHPGYASFSKAAILTLSPTLTWGAAPFDSFVTVDGVDISHNLKLSPVKTNNLGTIGMRLTDLQLTAKFQPAGAFAATDILTATGGNAVLGASPTVNNLNISYSGFYVRLYAACLRQASFKWGTGDGDNLIQGIEARATRTFSAGAAIALGYVGTAAPV